VPVAVVPQETLLTVQARTSLPESIPHRDATESLAAATVLGAALASGSRELLRSVLGADRLHEPYRAGDASLLGGVRDALPGGALGATLSGAGPAVVVWAEPGAEREVARELGARYADADILPLAVSREGTRRV
jgi:homoserine kinase